MEPQDGLAGLSQLRARLDGLREYAELVAAQEAAVAVGDLDLAESLAADRELLQERLDMEAALHPAVAIDPEDEPEFRAVADETTRVLHKAAELHARLVNRLEGIRGDTREGIDGMERRTPAVNRYLGSRGRNRKGVNIRF